MMVYLAGKMSGIPDYNKSEFAKYADQLRRDGYSVFNPAASNMETLPIEEIFAYDLAFLCKHADAIALIPGWEESEGAVAEHAVAKRLKKQMIFL